METSIECIRFPVFAPLTTEGQAMIFCLDRKQLLSVTLATLEDMVPSFIVVQQPPLMLYPHDYKPEGVFRKLVYDLTKDTVLPKKLEPVAVSKSPVNIPGSITDAAPISSVLPEGYQRNVFGTQRQTLGKQFASRGYQPSALEIQAQIIENHFAALSFQQRALCINPGQRWGTQFGSGYGFYGLNLGMYSASKVLGPVINAVPLAIKYPGSNESHPFASPTEQEFPFSKAERKQNWCLEPRPRVSSGVIDKYYYHMPSNKQFRSEVEVYNFIEYAICPRHYSKKEGEAKPTIGLKRVRGGLISRKVVGYYISKPQRIIYRFPPAIAANYVENPSNDERASKMAKTGDCYSAQAEPNVQSSTWKYPGIPLYDFETIAPGRHYNIITTQPRKDSFL